MLTHPRSREASVARLSMNRHAYFLSRSRSSIEMPCGPRRKQMRTPGRIVVGSFVNSTPLALISAATASMSFDGQPEMIEPLIGRHRRGVDAVACGHRRDEDVGATELDVDAAGAADDLAAEDVAQPCRGRLGIGTAQMNVVPGHLRHRRPPLRVGAPLLHVALRRNLAVTSGQFHRRPPTKCRNIAVAACNQIRRREFVGSGGPGSGCRPMRAVR